MLWALLLQPYPKSTINSKVFFYCSTVSWFHFTSLYNKDTDSLIYRFVLAGRSRSVALRSFKYFWHASCARNLSCWKFDNGPVTIFTQLMAGFYFVPRNVCTNMVQNSEGWALFDHVNWRCAHNLHTFSTGVLFLKRTSKRTTVLGGLRLNDDGDELFYGKDDWGKPSFPAGTVTTSFHRNK